MVMKRTFRIIVLTVWTGAVISSAQEVDRLLAAVNGRVITELDLKMARTLNAVLDLGRNKPPPSRKEELNQMIDQELIRQEMDNYPVPQAQIDAVVQEKIAYLRNVYAEIGGLPALLSQLGLEAAELTKKVRIIVLNEKFISLRFSPFVIVSDEEVEQYYRLKLIPDMTKRGLPAPSLAEVSSQIEVLLKEIKKGEAATQWLENIRKNSRIELFVDVSSPAEKKQS
jgi:hypothetical protein